MIHFRNLLDCEKPHSCPKKLTTAEMLKLFTLRFMENHLNNCMTSAHYAIHLLPVEALICDLANIAKVLRVKVDFRAGDDVIRPTDIDWTLVSYNLIIHARHYDYRQRHLAYVRNGYMHALSNAFYFLVDFYGSKSVQRAIDFNWSTEYDCCRGEASKDPDTALDTNSLRSECASFSEQGRDNRRGHARLGAGDIAVAQVPVSETTTVADSEWDFLAPWRIEDVAVAPASAPPKAAS